MKNLCLLVVILLSAGMICCGCSRSEDNSTKSDKDIMQGAWAGNAANIDSPFEFTVDANNFELKAPDMGMWYKGTFTLNKQAAPKEADFLINNSSFQEYIGCTAKSVYKIEDGTLIIAGNEPTSDARPTTFEASDVTQVFTLKRK